MSLKDLVQERRGQILDGPLRDDATLVKYIDRAMRLSYHVLPMTITFHNGKFKKFTKRNFNETEGHEIHDYISEYLYDRDEIMCYFRLDIGEKLRFHYHGFVVGRSLARLMDFKARLHKTFGYVHMDSSMKNPKAYVSYCLGTAKVDKNGVVVNDSKVALQEYLDQHIYQNLYTLEEL